MRPLCDDKKLQMPGKKGNFRGPGAPANLDAPNICSYTSAVSRNGHGLTLGANPLCGRLACGMEEDFIDDVAALRTDGQEPAGGPQGEPFQYQDQTALHAEPVQRDLHFRCARPQYTPAGLDQRDQERRSQWRARCVPSEGEGLESFAARARAEASDREEAAEGSACQEGELKLSSEFAEFEAAGSKDPAVFHSSCATRMNLSLIATDSRGLVMRRDLCAPYRSFIGTLLQLHGLRLAIVSNEVRTP